MSGQIWLSYAEKEDSMSNPHVVSALAHKYSELMGHQQKLQSQITAVHSDIEAIKASILLFSPDYKFERLKAKRTNECLPGFQRGELSKLVSDFVRKAEGRFLTTDAIRYVSDLKHHCEFDKKQASKIGVRVHGALKRLESTSVIIEDGRTAERNTIIWKKVPIQG